jgi:hypothetical protein
MGVVGRAATLLFPLILSGMMLPLDTGPEWMQVMSS